MKIKTSELTGIALDWAVAKCEGYDDIKRNPHAFNDSWIIRKSHDPYQWHWLSEFSPSTNWSLGGPIIEREDISTAAPDPLHEHWTGMKTFVAHKMDGPTPLIAALRCYVASKLGDEVEILDELLEN